MFIDCATVLCILYGTGIYDRRGDCKGFSHPHLECGGCIVGGSDEFYGCYPGARGFDITMAEMVHREERQHMRGSEDQSKTGHKQHWSHFDKAMLAGDQAGQPPQKQRGTRYPKDNRRRPECAAAGFVNRCRGGALVPVRWGWWWQPLTRLENQFNLPSVVPGSFLLLL